MAWIPPVEQRIDAITFCTFNSDYEFASIDRHYVNIVVEKSAAEMVYLDGALIPSSSFSPVRGTDNYCYVRMNISHGTHHLSCALGLIAHVYGFGQARGYAYCVGANVMMLKQKLLVDGLWSEFFADGYYMCNDEDVDLAVETNYRIDAVRWDYGDGHSGQGEEVSHHYDTGGDFPVTAYVLGFNEFSLEVVHDTLSTMIHVGEPMYHEETHEVCDEDVFNYYGVEFTQSGHYEQFETSIYGCEQALFLTLDMEFTPNFGLIGNHWPIGGSETHISVNEYAVRLTEPRTKVDTVLWQIDCPNWYVEPHGDKGKECTLYIFSYLLEPVTLHAWTINRCDTVHEEFFIQTSYYDVDENLQDAGFSVIPNPTDGNMTLRFGEMEGVAEICVYNSLGQKVDGFSINTDLYEEMPYLMLDLKNGLYYFVMKCNGSLLTRKVMLVR